MILEMDEKTLTGQKFEDTPFMSIAKFSEEIEKIVIQSKMSYMEAVLHFCTENSLEPDDVAPFVSTLLKQKIEQDAIENGMLPKRSQLPI